MILRAGILWMIPLTQTPADGTLSVLPAFSCIARWQNARLSAPQLQLQALFCGQPPRRNSPAPPHGLFHGQRLRRQLQFSGQQHPFLFSEYRRRRQFYQISAWISLLVLLHFLKMQNRGILFQLRLDACPHRLGNADSPTLEAPFSLLDFYAEMQKVVPLLLAFFRPFAGDFSEQTASNFAQMVPCLLFPGDDSDQRRCLCGILRQHPHRIQWAYPGEAASAEPFFSFAYPYRPPSIRKPR